MARVYANKEGVSIENAAELVARLKISTKLQSISKDKDGLCRARRLYHNLTNEVREIIGSDRKLCLIARDDKLLVLIFDVPADGMFVPAVFDAEQNNFYIEVEE